MNIDHKDYDDVTAVNAKGFWYNLVAGTFRSFGQEEADFYEFEYRRRSHLSERVRMQVRADAVEAVQYASDTK
jgi:hypothetical protein